jgi:hypothetical protein
MRIPMSHLREGCVLGQLPSQLHHRQQQRVLVKVVALQAYAQAPSNTAQAQQKQ